MSIESATQILTSNKKNFRPGSVTVASRSYGWLISFFNGQGQSKSLKVNGQGQPIAA